MAKSKAQYAFIYALLDPRDHRTRYVGTAIDPLKRFYNHHMQGQDNTTLPWVLELAHHDKEPILWIVKRTLRGDRWDCERRHIEDMKPDLNVLKKEVGI